MKSILSGLNKLIDKFPIKDKETTSLLLQTPPENSIETQLILIKNLTDRGFKFIILSGGRPCMDIINIFEEKKINLKNIHILDMVCRTHKLSIKEQQMVTHLNSMKELTKIVIFPIAN